jgi:RNA-binding protein
MPLTEIFKKQLRRKAHSLNPVILIGNKGLTDAVQLEIERTLFDHELIKIKINHGDRDIKKQIIEKICKDREAELIQTIGHVAVIYREAEEKE